MSLSPDQLHRRLAGITATDVAAICGVHPQRSAISVWMEKRGEAPPWVDTDRTIWGDILEAPVRADYARRHGVRVEEPGTLEHPDAPWMMATPDGVAYPVGGTDPMNGIEIKCHTIRLAHLYGAPGTDEVPPHELAQCAWNMAVTGLVRWDLVAFIDNQPREFVIDRDDEVIEGLRERAERFLVDNVRGGVPPDPDGSDAYDDWLKARWTKNTGDLIDIDADPDLLAMLSRGKAIREEEAALDDELQALKQALKARIGDKAGLTWRDDGRDLKLTWKRSKPTKRVDHAGMARDAWQGAALIASGHRADVATIATGLRAAGDVATRDRAAALLEKLHAALVEIGARSETGYTTEIPGNRPLTWPRTWKARPERAKE
jgi:putative phage-type endonuclease